MKNKYQRMDKTEKKAIRKQYLTNEEGKAMAKRLQRLYIFGVCGIAYSIGWNLYNYISNKTIWDYISASIFGIVSIIFIVSAHKIKVKVLNKEALKNMK